MTVIVPNNVRKLAKIILSLAEVSKEMGRINVEPEMMKKFQRKLKSIDSYSEQSLSSIFLRVLEGAVTDEDMEDLRELSGENNMEQNT